MRQLMWLSGAAVGGLAVIVGIGTARNALLGSPVQPTQVVVATLAPTTAPVQVATPVPPVTAPLPPTAAPVQPTQAPTTQVIPPTSSPSRAMSVRGTGGSGVIIRREPNGERIASANEGDRVADLGEERQSAGRAWRKIRAPDGTEGWAAAEFLSAGPGSVAESGPTATAPAVTATSAPTAPPAATATRPAPVIAAPPALVVPTATRPAPTTAPVAPRTAPPPPATSTPPPSVPPPSGTTACCRRCSTGKPCGDSCISRSYNCNKGPGCACSASIPGNAEPVSMTEEELAVEAIELARINGEPTEPCEEIYALVSDAE